MVLNFHPHQSNFLLNVLLTIYHRSVNFARKSLWIAIGCAVN